MARFGQLELIYPAGANGKSFRPEDAEPPANHLVMDSVSSCWWQSMSVQLAGKTIDRINHLRDESKKRCELLVGAVRGCVTLADFPKDDSLFDWLTCPKLMDQPRESSAER